MAAKRSSRSVLPPTRSGNPNVPIIIFLVFSLLGNMVLGVFYYLAQDKIAQAERKTKEADDKLKKQTADTNLDHTYYMVRLRTLLDPKSVSDEEFDRMMRLEKERADALQANRPVDTRHDLWYKALVDSIESKIGKYDAVTNRDTAPSFDRVIADKDQRIRDLTATVARVNNEKEGIETAFNQYKKDWSQEKFDSQFKAEMQKIQDDYKRKEANLQAQINTLKASFDKVKADFDAYVADSQAKFDREQAKFAKEKKELEDKIKEIQLTATAPDAKSRVGTSDELDEPRGRIVRAEADGETVIIDLGSDHRVVPQLTFTVHGIGSGGRPLREPKAKIEVISILSKDQSLARVTRMFRPETQRENDNPENEKNWFKDPRDFWRARNPIKRGDVLYNPAWAPNRKVHIALNGVFDLDGDGKEDFATLRRLLEERGAVIDAWLDPEGGKFEMRGKITEKTEFVVIGARPQFIAPEVRPGEPKPEWKDGFEKMEREALSRAIEPISLKRFLTRMGYTDLSLPASKGGGLATPYGEPAPKGPANDRK